MTDLTHFYLPLLAAHPMSSHTLFYVHYRNIRLLHAFSEIELITYIQSISRKLWEVTHKLLHLCKYSTMHAQLVLLVYHSQVF